MEEVNIELSLANSRTAELLEGVCDVDLRETAARHEAEAALTPSTSSCPAVFGRD